VKTEADQLRADIAAAEKQLQEVESRPIPKAQLAQVQHQIKIAKDGLRSMRIKLASLENRSNCCPVCSGTIPPGWLVCEPCSREVPAKLHTEWQCARGHAHAAVSNKKSAARIAATQAAEHSAASLIIAHLKQHGSAL
jgi:DNA repair exonuclease SbcCD ATPase subunit